MIEFFNNQGDPLFQALWVHASICCVLFVLTVIVLKARSRWSAHSRHRVLQICSALVLVSFLIMFLPRPDIPALSFSSESQPVTSVNHAGELGGTEPAITVSSLPAMIADDPVERFSAAPVQTVSSESSTGMSASTIMVMLWLVVTVALFVRLLFRSFQLHRFVRSARPLSNTRIVSDLAKQHFGNRTFTLRQHAGLSTPLTAGLFQSVIVVPAGYLDEGDNIEKRSVLLHEMGHALRHDTLDQLLCELNKTLFWFNPVSYLLARAQAHERECACDDIARLSGIEANAYSSHLLELAVVQTRVAPGVALGVSLGEGLRKRFLALFDARRDRRQRLSRAAVFSTGAVLVLSVISLLATMPRVTLIETAQADVTDGSEPGDGNANIDVSAELTIASAIRSGSYTQLRQLLQAHEQTGTLASDRNHPMRWAIELGDVVAFKIMQEAGLTWNTDRASASLATVMAARHSTAILETLLAEGADPNSMDNQYSALYAAIYQDQMASVRLLIDAGADVNFAASAQLQFRQVPKAVFYEYVLLAIGKNNVQLLAWLIDAGAQLDRETIFLNEYYYRQAYTPLIAATEKGHKDQIRLLLDAGVDPNQGTHARRGSEMVYITPMLVAEFHEARFEKSGVVDLIEAAGGARDPRSPSLDAYWELVEPPGARVALTYDLDADTEQAIRSVLVTEMDAFTNEMSFYKPTRIARMSDDEASVLLSTTPIQVTENQRKTDAYSCNLNLQVDEHWQCEPSGTRQLFTIDGIRYQITSDHSVSEAQVSNLINVSRDEVTEALNEINGSSKIRYVFVTTRDFMSPQGELEGSGYLMNYQIVSEGSPVEYTKQVQIQDGPNGLELYKSYPVQMARIRN